MFDKIVSAAIGMFGNSFFKGGGDGDYYTPSVSFERIQTTPIKEAGKTQAYQATNYQDLVRQWESYLTSYQQMKRKR